MGPFTCGREKQPVGQGFPPGAVEGSIVITPLIADGFAIIPIKQILMKNRAGFGNPYSIAL
jgi:hypothetical protein